MKTYPMVAIAILGVWMAGSASVQAETLIELTAPGAVQDVALVGSAVDRHPPLATQYAELTRYGVDRHPPLATQYAEPTGQEPIQVVLQFGTETKNFAMTPKALRLEKGKLYEARDRKPEQDRSLCFGSRVWCGYRLNKPDPGGGTQARRPTGMVLCCRSSRHL